MICFLSELIVFHATDRLPRNSVLQGPAANFTARQFSKGGATTFVVDFLPNPSLSVSAIANLPRVYNVIVNVTLVTVCICKPHNPYLTSETDVW